jgi:replicative DNA helicase
LNISSAFLKQVLVLQDFETWAQMRQHYLPPEYHRLFTEVDRHCEKFHTMPTIEQLQLGLRDDSTKELLYAVENVDVDVEASILLQYLKNDFTQKEILNQLEDYVDNSISFEDAEESVRHLHQIVLDVEDKVELQLPEESMQSIQLFDPDEDLGKYLSLGLNNDHDQKIMFSPRDLILVGGQSGAGKSNTCVNIANNVYESGKTAIYFTIEMDSRSILQRCCSLATGVPFSRLRTKNLSNTEWDIVAGWWANRFSNSQEELEQFKNDRDFDKFHKSLKSDCELLPTQQLDVIYDPSLTIAKIRSELDKKVKSKMDVGVIIVDYINQVKRSNLPSRGGQYDWTEQIEVSKALKGMAQEYDTPVFSPYQTDAGGGARFAKGILDAADAAYSLEPWGQEDACMTFNCVKMRSAAMTSFTSTMDWETLKIGPHSALSPKEREANDQKTGEAVDDL